MKPLDSCIKEKMKHPIKSIGYRTTEEILRRNPQISKSVVTQYAELEKKLKNLGVDTKPRYTLSHPFRGIDSNSQKQ